MSSKKNIQSYGRFKNLPWFDKTSESVIFVGGAGGIGSWLTLFLARAGANVVVADMDTVEEHNLAGQVYGREDIGKLKVEALSDVVNRLCSQNSLTLLNKEITEEDGEWYNIIPLCDVVCVGFDNLKARGIIYKFWKDYGKEGSLFVDGRLSAESGQVFTLTKDSEAYVFEAYERTYFPESERVELPCTMKATSHCGAYIASLMTVEITNYFNNITEGTLPRQTGNTEFHLALGIVEQSSFVKTINYEEA